MSAHPARAQPAATWAAWRLEHRGLRRRRRLLLAGLLIAGAAFSGAGFWIPAKAALAQQLLNRAWHASSDERRAAKPWPWADTWPVARLRLPGHDAPLTVLAGASGRNLAFGPAVMDGSAAPGTPGVSVIAGHRDTHFRSLADLAIGDRFVLEQRDGSMQTYEVAARDVIDTARTGLELTANEPVIALVTCYPFDAAVPGGTLRFVVTAYPAPGSRKPPTAAG